MGKVRYGQAGYVGCAMSERAVEAYELGEKPKSKWTKKAMLDAIEEYCDEFGIAYDEKLSKMKKAELFERFFEWRSWHHTGVYAVETNFYGLNEQAVCELGGTKDG